MVSLFWLMVQAVIFFSFLWFMDFLFYGKRYVAAWGFRQAFFFPNSGAGAFGSVLTFSRIEPPHHGLSSDLSIASILHWALSHCYVFKAFLSGGPGILYYCSFYFFSLSYLCSTHLDCT